MYDLFYYFFFDIIILSYYLLIIAQLNYWVWEDLVTLELLTFYVCEYVRVRGALWSVLCSTPYTIQWICRFNTFSRIITKIFDLLADLFCCMWERLWSNRPFISYIYYISRYIGVQYWWQENKLDPCFIPYPSNLSI